MNHRSFVRSVLAFTVLSLVAAACADTPAPSQPVWDIAPFDAGFDAGLPVDVGVDAGTPLDTAVADVAEGKDTALPDTSAGACPGAPGCECKANDDCDNAICIDDPNADNATGKICAQTCIDGCTDGYKCVQAAPSGGDPIGLCVPKYGNICHPCTTSGDCKSVGHTDTLCVDQGELGGFCGTGCTADTDCPETYACLDVKSVEGASAKQCVKKGDGGAYGVCDCSKVAIKQQLTTGCMVEHKNDKGEVIATCKGTRSCLPAGLSKCAAPAVGSETCDGLDNDCDGDVDEGTCDDGNGCTVDACDGLSAKCTSIPAQDGLACDADGSSCTDGDACSNGKCQAGKLLGCDDTNPCTKDSCDPKTGCNHEVSNGVSCSDDNPCTIGDVCKDASCESGKPKACSSPSACKVAKCSVDDGKCKFEDAIEGLPCEDGNKCTENDGCSAGSCKAGKVVDCDDGNACTTNKCDGVKGCVTEINNKPCDGDQSACTVGDICKDKVCITGTLKTCDDKNPCTSDSCDKQSGQCVFDPKPNAGDPCDDGKGCTEKDVCTAGVCKGQNATCEDNNPCTTDKCDAAAGKCVHDGTASEGKLCDDNEACTKGDKCTAGKCAGVGKVCNDDNPCTVDSCSLATGSCSYDSNATQGQACEDGNACTQGDKCATGKCVGVAVTCDDNNACTADSCDAKLGKCVYSGALKDNAPCNDGNKCTQNDKCGGGKCAGSALSCDDSDPCTIDTCDSTIGCQHKTASDGTTCSANGLQVCKAGKCVGKCTSTCPGAGAKQCGQGGGVQVCSDADKDGCDEWGQEVACANTETCKAGACVQNQAPFDMVINEVLYDNVGSDTSTFIELRGPKGASLAGWSLVGIDGNGAKTYATIELKGAIPADGLFVVAKTGAEKWVADYADMFASAADLQNGPDNVQLLYGGVVVDALGYGTFGGTIVFKGEGNPAEDVAAGSSLGRDAQGTDNDDNSKDFKAYTTPTPGKLNVTPNVDPKAALVCPGGGKPGQVLSFDGSGSTDADGKIVSYTFDFGDGTQPVQGTAAVVTHSYAKAGTFAVKLIVVDDGGAPSVANCSMVISAANVPPVAQLACPGKVNVGVAANFDASGSSDSDGKIVNWAFDFGDGSPLANLTVAKTTHTYTKAGTFTAKVAVKDDAGAIHTASCQVSVGATNKPPVANMSCPAGAQVGAQVTFDASGSSDSDGTIKSYSFVPGDGSAAQTGTASKITYTYTKAGTFTASVKVTDDLGATAQTSCSVVVSASAPPIVIFVKPQDGSLFTQGEKVDFLVDATAKGGKSVKTVTLKQGNTVIGADSSAPYTFSWTVPANAVTGSTLDFTALAADSAGSVGTSTPLKLKIVNDKPNAAFTAIVSGALEVELDASLCSDTETPKAQLQVRWDYENDGVWDTPFSTTKALKKTYAQQGSYTIKMEVKDAVGQTATATRNVNLSLIKQVSGTINTTTWVGTVIVTGDIIVPKGQVLTIAKGTSVQFAPIDQNKDGYGDYNVYVYGKLNVVGSADQPVVFTVYGTQKTPGKAWQRIQLSGEGSNISHAVIEYARWGIEAHDTSTISNVTSRLNYHGIYAQTPAKLTATGLTITQNLNAGIYANSNVTLNLDKSEVSGNGAEGIYFWATTPSTLNLTDSTVSGNKKAGVRALGSVGGKIMHNLITGNDWEGLRIAAYKTVDPTLIVNYNNIIDNAKVGAREVTVLGISASQSGSSSGTKTSSVAGTPTGAKIDHLRYVYSEQDYSSYITGTIRKDSASGSTLFSASSSTSGWLDLTGQNVSKVVAQVYKGTSSSSYYGTMSLSAAAYDVPGLKREVSVLTRSGTIDLRHNYYGVFPDVLSRVTLSHPDAANLHGFVGVKFDASWKKGPYFGGETLGADTAWNDTIWLTGDLVIAAGKTLTIAPGTQVHIIHHDQDKNGVGDFDIYASGAIVAKAPKDAGILIHGYGTGQVTGKGWERIRLLGAGSVFENVIIEHGVTGVEGSSTTALKSVTIRNNTVGVRSLGSGHFTITDSLIHKQASHGIEIQTLGKLTLTGGQVIDNGGSGVFSHATDTATLLNATGVLFSGNNRMGIELGGNVGGLITKCQITANAYEGLRLEPYSNKDPAIAVHFNNIWGNATVGAREVIELGLSASQSGSSSGTKTSAVKGTPLGERIDFAYYSFSEQDYSSYISGTVRKDSANGTTLISASTSSSAWQDVHGSNANKLVAQVYKGTSSSSYYGTMSVPRVAYDKKGLKREVSVLTKGTTVDMRTNWYGVFPGVLDVVTLSHPTAANIHGFVGVKFDDKWAVGPYRGGESLSGAESWSGTVWITGDLTIPAGAALTLASGTQVRFVAHDQDKNGVGDFDITVSGTLDAQGKAAAKVLFTVEGAANQKKNAWARVYGTGASSKVQLTHVDMAWGENCLYLTSGAHTLTSTKVHDCGSYGVRVQSATSVALNSVELTANTDHALYIHGSSKVTIGSADIHDNAATGISVSSSTSGLVFKNLMISKNKKAGVHLLSSSVALSSCNLSYNQIGIHYAGNSTGTMSLCDVKYNDNEGLLLESVGGQSPNPKITDNNIFGNSVLLGGVIDAFNLSASQSGSSSGTKSSAAKGLPDGAKMLWMRYSFSEQDYSSYISGTIRKDSASGSSLVSASTSVGLRWHDLRSSNVTTLVAQVYKGTSSSSYYGTMTVAQAFYRKAKQAREMVALTDAYKVNLTANYWGVFPDVLPLLALSRTDAVDFSGMKIMAVQGTGPQ